ncbi:MAG: class I SAM-dependent methyltransferase [Candidatus Omnitrophica bacterium]|nr:class I SAM-dependent methyltransferase [Candidatus Omnitrophota bacterium]
MNKSNVLEEQYAGLKTNVNALIQSYEERLNSIDPFGMGLYARITSCVQILRDCDDRFFEKTNPDQYLNQIFQRQIEFLDTIDALMKRLDIKGKFVDTGGLSDNEARDMLHKDLFNQTWHTLKMSGDPFNDYQPYINLINKRLAINGLDQRFFQGKKTLDVGCGTGRFCFSMAGLGADAWGIDPGSTSIEQAQQLAKSFHMENQTHFIVGNAYALPFEDKSFDFVVCNGVLHHLDSPELALKEIHRVLKNDGDFWLYIEGSGGIYHDVWSLICRSFNNISLSRTLEAVKQLKIPNMHFWTDIFYAKYHLVSWDENVARLKRIGFKEVIRKKGAELIDLDIEMFKDDPFAKIKFGDGGLRMLIRK